MKIKWFIGALLAAAVLIGSIPGPAGADERSN